MCMPSFPQQCEYRLGSSLVDAHQRIRSVSSLVGVGIVCATRFYTTFTDIMSTCFSTFIEQPPLHHACPGLIGYWSVVHGVMVLIEHFVFRKMTLHCTTSPPGTRREDYLLAPPPLLPFFVPSGSSFLVWTKHGMLGQLLRQGAET